MDEINRDSSNPPMPTQDPNAVVDLEEFVVLYRQTFSHLALIATGIIGDRTHAEDIVQEAAIIAFEKRRTLAPNSNVAAWMAGIVRKCALNYARKMRGRKTTPADPVLIDQTSEHAETSASTLSVADASALPDDQAMFDDDVLSALKSLGADARCCLLLRVIEELSYHEISELMDMPEGTAMSHVHRAKAALRQRLGPTAPQQADLSQDA